MSGTVFIEYPPYPGQCCAHQPTQIEELPHFCGEPKGHWGKHVCDYCGWAFGETPVHRIMLKKITRVLTRVA